LNVEHISHRHAKRQMKWRKISAEEVKNTIFNAENIEDSIKGRKNAFKHINKRRLKVTFAKENNTIIIITVIDKKKK